MDENPKNQRKPSGILSHPTNPPWPAYGWDREDDRKNSGEPHIAASIPGFRRSDIPYKGVDNGEIPSLVTPLLILKMLPIVAVPV